MSFLPGQVWEKTSLPAMEEGGSVFFSFFPLGILISNSEKYNPCMVGFFFPGIHITK